MNDIEIFKNNEFGEIRTTIIDGEPWFVGKDVATALGYIRTADAVAAHVDGDDKGVCKTPTPGGEQDVTVINESGLYSLILSSKLPDAKKFKHWVTHDVLPALRKTGTYKMQENGKPSVSVQDGIAWVEGVSRLLSLNDSSKLTLLKQFGEPLGLPVPNYTASKGTLHSATELLKMNNISLSSRGFNQLAVTNGILREMERKSHRGVKRYKNLTDKGLAYGENQVNPQNPKETQPMYYDDKFMGLCKILGVEPINH